MRTKHWIAISIIFSFIRFSLAQTPELIIDNIHPPSPEASALGKYGEYPVSLYTGVPSISIPIWDVKTKQIHVPVSISYHASGIRVDEIASNVGLGWALNAGGIITRSVRGLADDGASGYYNVSFDESNIENGTTVGYIAEKLKDGEADIFYYNFCGQSGRFFFNLDQEIIQVEKQELDISVSYSSAFVEFIITTPDGTKYYFGKDCFDCSGEDYREESKITNVSHTVIETYYSSWYLRKIESLNGEEVNFIYESIGSSDKLQSVHESVVVNAETFNQIAEDENISYSYVLNQKRLDSILFDGGALIFHHDTAREDVNNGESLDIIEIENSYEDLVRSYKLYHSYYDADYDIEFALRLRLDSIVEFGASGTLRKPHTFSYFETYTLPPRRSSWASVTANEYYSQDHWGFFNGKEYNYTLIPTFAKEEKKFPAADREPKWPYTKTNMLEKIKYPTGGYTTFEFEPNYIGYLGKDTVSGYYEAATLNGSMNHCDSIYTGVYSDTFAINDDALGLIALTMSLNQTNCSDQATDPAFTLSIRDLSTGNSVKSWSLSCVAPNLSNSFNEDYLLDSGQYYIHAIYHKSAEFSWAIAYNEYIDEDLIIDREQEAYGGVRIKSIKNYDSNDSLASYKDYRYLTNINSGESTGHPISKPSYYHLETKVTQYPWNSGQLEMTMTWESIFRSIFRKKSQSTPIVENDLPINFFENNLGIAIATNQIVLNSTPTYEVGTTQGGIIGYASVIQLYSGGGECSIFTSIDDYPEYDSKYISYGNSGGTPTAIDYHYGDNSDFPYPPTGNKDHYRGKLLCKFAFDSSYQTVFKEEYEYQDIEFKKYSSLKASPNTTVSEGEIVGSDNNISAVRYYNTSSSFPLALKREISYVDGIASTYKITKYLYPDSVHYQLEEEKTYTSKGDSLRTLFYYPYDTEVSSYSNVSAMEDSNYVAVPLRTDQYLNTTLTDRSARLFNSDLLQEYTKLYDFDEADFRTVQEFSDYDDANLLEFTDSDQLESAVVWGYTNQYPVVIAKNVSQSTLSSAVSSALPTGYSSLEALIDAVHSNSSNMDDWHDFNKDLREASSLSEAEVTTILHKPLVGKICETGPGMITSYYEYDGLGRLHLIRDNDGNILQEYEYNYAQ